MIWEDSGSSYWTLQSWANHEAPLSLGFFRSNMGYMSLQRYRGNLATEVQVFFNLKSQYMTITRKVQSLEAPTVPTRSFPQQAREFVRQAIAALIAPQPYRISHFLPACFPLTQAYVTEPWRRKSGGVRKREGGRLLWRMRWYSLGIYCALDSARHSRHITTSQVSTALQTGISSL